jgi:hypothetical protein
LDVSLIAKEENIMGVPWWELNQEEKTGKDWPNRHEYEAYENGLKRTGSRKITSHWPLIDPAQANPFNNACGYQIPH